jgi:hypothetical protein
MGSGFKNFTATVLTASDVNNFLMEQTVMTFVSTGARDTQITAPEAGMVAYVRSNDSSEGLYTYSSALGWRKGPGWNAPWGAVSAPATKISAMPTFTTTAPADFTGLTITFNQIQNRMYRCTFQSLFDNPVGITSTGVLSIFNNTSSTQIQQGNYTLPSFGFTVTHLQGIYTAGSSASVTIKVRGGVAGAGQQFRSYGDATFPALLMIEDIGPNGAPV